MQPLRVAIRNAPAALLKPGAHAHLGLMAKFVVARYRMKKAGFLPLAEGGGRIRCHDLASARRGLVLPQTQAE